MKLGRLSVRQVAERLGEDERAVREELQFLDKKHGRLLHRRQGRRTKMWVDEPRLRELVKRYGGAPTERDVTLLHNRVDRVELLAERALQRVGRVEQKVSRAPQS